MARTAAVRVPIGQSDDELQSIVSDRSRSQDRNATQDSEELGSTEWMELVDNLRIDDRMRSTPSDERSVRKNRSTWRSLDRNAAEGQPARKF